MTVREFIGFMNPEKILDGSVSFKVIWNGDIENEWGEKWFFYHDMNETPEEDTIEKFCNNPGIVGCMDMEIDPITIECVPDEGEEGTIFYLLHVYRRMTNHDQR